MDGRRASLACLRLGGIGRHGMRAVKWARRLDIPGDRIGGKPTWYWWRATCSGRLLEHQGQDVDTGAHAGWSSASMQAEKMVKRSHIAGKFMALAQCRNRLCRHGLDLWASMLAVFARILITRVDTITCWACPLTSPVAFQARVNAINIPD